MPIASALKNYRFQSFLEVPTGILDKPLPDPDGDFGSETAVAATKQSLE
jgi:hypothetical protein